MISYAYPNVADILDKMRTGVCNVYVKVNREDANGVTKVAEEELLYEQIPCDVSSESVTPTTNGVVAYADQKITMFLRMEYEIPLGSRIVVTQHGRTREYTNSGEPDFYLSHQEIPLTLIDTKA